MVVFQSMILTLGKHIVPVIKQIKQPTIVDIGAHLGFFSLPLAELLKNPRIYALEPVSITFKLLKKNTQDTKSIRAFHCGLLDKSAKMAIYYNPQLLLYSSLFSERFMWDKNPYKETVSLITLDSFCRKNGITHINLLKIDAEGAEEKILRGGSKILSRTQYLFIECSLDRVDHSTFTSFLSCLFGKNYNFQLLKITSTLEGKGRLLLVNMLFENLLFKRNKNPSFS